MRLELLLVSLPRLIARFLCLEEGCWRRQLELSIELGSGGRLFLHCPSGKGLHKVIAFDFNEAFEDICFSSEVQVNVCEIRRRG
jgi:hypothetical protein